MVPDVRLTRSKDGANGTATFVFNQPSVFEASSEFGDITGLYMLDDEGEILTVEVSAKFVNGKPDRIEAIHIMRSPGEWDRFMRFMERYSEDKGLGFQKVNLLSLSCQMSYVDPDSCQPNLVWPPFLLAISCIRGGFGS